MEYPQSEEEEEQQQLQDEEEGEDDLLVGPPPPELAEELDAGALGRPSGATEGWCWH